MSSITHKLFEPFEQGKVDTAETAAAVEGFKHVLADMIENHKVGGFYDKSMPWSYGLSARMCTYSGWFIVSTVADGLMSEIESDVDINTDDHKRLDITCSSFNPGDCATKVMGNIIAARNLVLPSEWYMVSEEAFEAIEKIHSHKKWVWSSWHHDQVWHALPSRSIKMVTQKRMDDLLSTTPSKKRKRKKVLARPLVLQAMLSFKGYDLSPWFDLAGWHQGYEDYDVVDDMMKSQVLLDGKIIKSNTEPLHPGHSQHWSKRSWIMHELYRMLRDSHEVQKNATVYRSLFGGDTRANLDSGTKRNSPGYKLRIIKRQAVDGRKVDNLSDDFSGEPEDHLLEIQETDYDYSGPMSPRRRAMKKARRKKA